MAKLSARGSVILDSFEAGNFRYSLRSDGAVLEQWYYEGRLQAPRIISKPTKDTEKRRQQWQAWKAKMLAR